MSRIFEALRKPQHAGSLTSPNPLLETVKEVHGLQSVAIEEVPIQPESRVIVLTDPGSVGADRFRLLRTRLRELRTGGMPKTLLVTSALPQDGKSTMSLNLATALAEKGKRSVLLLEADLYRPSLTKVLGLRPGPGLAECLQGESEPMMALRRIEPLGWYFLHSGRLVNNPTELVQSERFSHLIATLESYFDWIVVDAPPAHPVADILALKAQADGCLLVVRAGRTPRELVEEAIRQLGREYVLAMILNGVEELDRLYSEYYGNYYYGGGSRSRSGQRKGESCR